MNHTIIMSKYQGLGNDYLILDPKKNKVELQGKKVALLCQRGFGLGADGVLYGPVEMEGKLGVRIYNKRQKSAGRYNPSIIRRLKYSAKSGAPSSQRIGYHIFSWL